jgi:hypothetical protein
VKIADVRRLDVAAARAAHAGDIARLDARAGCLTVMAVGLDCRVQTTVQVDGEDIEAVYIEADPLARALHIREGDHPVDLRVTDTAVLVQHGEYRLRLPLVRAAPFDWSAREPAWMVTEALQEAIRRVASILPKDDPLGVLVEWRDGSLLVAAVKRSRHVHAIRLDCPAGAGRFCLSRGAADQILRVGDLTGWGEMDGSLLFRSDVSILRVSPVRDGFPRAFDDVLADTSSMEAEVRRDDVVAALRAVGVVLAKEDEHVVIAAVAQTGDEVVFQVTARTASGSATASEKFLGRSTAPVPWTGTCNIKDLTASLAAVDGEVVQLGLGQKSILLRDGRFRALLALMVG